jgi:hypothetical protein
LALDAMHTAVIAAINILVIRNSRLGALTNGHTA